MYIKHYYVQLPSKDTIFVLAMVKPWIVLCFVIYSYVIFLDFLQASLVSFIFLRGRTVPSSLKPCLVHSSVYPKRYHR